MKLRVLDLFSGIGGFSLGLERAGGFETVAFCEIEPYCRRVLAKHWPSVPCYDDVRTLTAERLAADGIAVDVICGGFPCQDISVLGAGAGLDGPRSGLLREVVRLAASLVRPTIIIENSPAFVRRGLASFLSWLAALGYDAEWCCVPASAAGAWHKRERFWLVAYPESIRRRPGLREAFSEQNGDFAAYRSWWDSEPGVCRVANGVSSGVERRRALGNSIVPIFPELIGKAIMQAEGLTGNMMREAAE